MFVDASALLAMLLQEPEGDALADAIEQAPRRLTSPIAIFETIAGLMRVRAVPRSVAEERLLTMLAAAEITTIDIDGEIGREALNAFDRYGKGRGHPAQLNMGDCFAYACARVHGVTLLYKGADFSQTELG